MRTVYAKRFALTALFVDVLFLILSYSVLDMTNDQVRFVIGFSITIATALFITNAWRWYKYGPVFDLKDTE